MTTEELLKRRWKVIADYPNSPFVAGQIFAIPNFDKEFTKKYWADDKDKYPHLFEPLTWWKDRKVEDMPEYVISIQQEYDYGVEVGEIIKVHEWVLLMKIPYIIQSKTREYHPSCFLPASKSDYESYIGRVVSSVLTPTNPLKQ